MRKHLTFITLLISLTVASQQKGIPVRTLQYTPQGNDFVCVNGTNRYTRPLYGSHTVYRVETSDRPVFAEYNKSKSHNVAFRITACGTSLPLDSTDFCKSWYSPGKRRYKLKDRKWSDKAELELDVNMLYDKEAAIFRFEKKYFMNDASLSATINDIRVKKLLRSGDMGVDRADCFEASLTEKGVTGSFTFTDGLCYLLLEKGSLKQLGKEKGEYLYNSSEKVRQALASQIRLQTPDPYINTLGGALVTAADGIWDDSGGWMHGANGWRMPLNGWRAAYTGDCIGWHDRARIHFDNYAASQVTDVMPIYPHPSQDSTKMLARAEKKWGTQMYSNGYICRNPRRNDQMHHYDMNLCYIDELLWHLCWTGDWEYARKVWPVITRHLEWEKRNFDPDDDGLYDAYCCIWASDALYYNSGAVTHSSAYNYRANRLAAEIAKGIGEDSAPYEKEAEKTRHAIATQLWMPEQGCWAEFRDRAGNRLMHTSPAVWTIYHAIDSDIDDMFRYYQATRYIDKNIPHHPILCTDSKINGYYTISTSNWLPYTWSINNVAFAEVMHTALAYWQAGRCDEAFRLFKGSVLDGMYLGKCPGNFGQISYYDAARGECYRDFADHIGIASRAIIQGLYGIQPDLLNGRVVIRPGFPSQWDHASLNAPYTDFSFTRDGDTDTYHIIPHFAKQANITLEIAALREDCDIEVNGIRQSLQYKEHIGAPLICISCGNAQNIEVRVRWKGKHLTHPAEYTNMAVAKGDSISLPAGMVTGIKDGQGLLSNAVIRNGRLSARISADKGQYTAFLHTKQGKFTWWEPLCADITDRQTKLYGTELPDVSRAEYDMITMNETFNACVTDIFKNEYISPRSPYTTLQIPLHGIGNWCHPKDTATIDDTGIREKAAGGVFTTPQGIPFRIPRKGPDIAFASLWDNYPDSLQVPLHGNAKGAFLLLAGSTNHMQCHITNALITARYSDGTSSTLPLVNPENWLPIEQDIYLDGTAFTSHAARPLRVLLGTGMVSNELEKELGLKGADRRIIEDGAATLLYMPLDKEKELVSIELKAVANEVVAGIMAITLMRQ